MCLLLATGLPVCSRGSLLSVARSEAVSINGSFPFSLEQDPLSKPPFPQPQVLPRNIDNADSCSLQEKHSHIPAGEIVYLYKPLKKERGKRSAETPECLYNRTENLLLLFKTIIQVTLQFLSPEYFHYIWI